MKLELCWLCKTVHLIRLLLKNYTTSIYITFVGWRTTKWKFKETAITVSPIYRVNFICFCQSSAELLLMTWSHFTLSQYKTCKHGFSYIVFLFLACECASLLSSDNLFLHLSWNSVAMRFCIFSEDMLMSCPCCWWMYYFQYSVHCNLETVILLWAGCMNLTRQSLLSSLYFITTPNNHFPPYVQA
jgi:hypothetical protein